MTGGLAAPALVPLLPFLSASTAPVVLGSLFGVAGGGLAGNRVRKRWGGVERFEFEQVSGGDEAAMHHEKTASYAVYRKKGQASDVKEKTDEKAENVKGGPIPPSLIATICIPGIALGSEDEGVYAYKDALNTLSNPIRDVFILKHSPDGTQAMVFTSAEFLRSCCSDAFNWRNTEYLGQDKATEQGYERSSRSNGVQCSTGGGRSSDDDIQVCKPTVACGVLFIIILRSTTGMALDNDWIRARDKARKAGDLLSEVLKEKVQGERPLTMVSHSANCTPVPVTYLVVSR